jgi:CRISPR/Cas system CSM-associated protein Csm3 (group 7 of RAMP superfamily)
MLIDTKDLFEVFGIGGMSTRGFGRLKVELDPNNEKESE